MSERWVFEVFQDGVVVASGSAPDRERALSEAAHYTMMYAQDGGRVYGAARKAEVADTEGDSEEEANQ